MLSFGNEADRTEHTEYSSKAEIKDYNVMINGRNIFDQLIGNNIKKLKTLGKLLLVKEMITQIYYPYFKEVVC